MIRLGIYDIDWNVGKIILCQAGAPDLRQETLEPLKPFPVFSQRRLNFFRISCRVVESSLNRFRLQIQMPGSSDNIVFITLRHHNHLPNL